MFQESVYHFDVISFIRSYLERAISFQIQPSPVIDRELYRCVVGDVNDGGTEPSTFFSLACSGGRRKLNHG